MRCFSLLAISLACCLGCDSSSQNAVVPPPQSSAAVDSSESDHGHEHSSFALTSENTQVLFVGAKQSGDSHKGGFKTVNGSITIGGDTIESIEVAMETDSLVSDVDRLTGHLKSEDFFSVQEFPEMKFVSTAIQGSGQVTVTGDLTMHGQTAEISFPATVTVNGENVELQSEFKVDRTKFGMDYTGQPNDPINAEVAITVIVGQGGLDESTIASAGGGGRRGGGGGDMFARQDSDGDGKLSGDEISEFLKPNMEQIDTDSDGALTREEMQAFFASRGFGGGRPGGGERPPRGERSRPQVEE